ncbi:MAG: glutamine synthetase III [Bacteroidia bacterium]|nr:glutamine synthetase III [Bacteroidia bacterium]
MSTNGTEKFGEYVFNEEAMRQYLSHKVIKHITDAILHGTKIDRKFADEIAKGMKEWAISKGVTHYAHWFQPLTGSTAEKHESFLKIEEGKPIHEFKGSELIQQEPDASSFPSGGIRNTFEARGYTAWDPSSPAFIVENGDGAGKTLCIPTIFISYTGEALDYKTPFLRSLHLLETNALAVYHYFDKDAKKVTATLGIEQEYFLIDKAFYYARPDLMMCGRTLVGREPSRGQQLEDHYFGSIPARVFAYMVEVEQEALKLGIPLKTRHNEVAPSQFECAPTFEEANLAIDHNQILMELMKRIADKHDFHVIFHEKPFAKINGSGKHSNWSMTTDTGKNLLSPGKNPKENLAFLTFFVNTIKAVYEHNALLRASIASAENDYRLGANEAPPAIISVFIGSQLTQILNEIVEGKEGTESLKQEIDLKLKKIPEILIDNTDRNRTSPFAFTGNKFEFRAVGASANCSAAITILNTIVAHQLAQFKKEVDAHIQNGMKKDEAIITVLKEYIRTAQPILFEGNGYSQEWVEEAERRGLFHVKTTPHALKAYISEKSRKLFEETHVLSPKELEAHYEVFLERYTKKIQIESRVLGELVLNQIIPTAVAYQQKLAQNVVTLSQLQLDYTAKPQIDLINRIAKHVAILKEEVEKMIEERKIGNKIEDIAERAIHYCEKVKPYLETIRYHVDKLEFIVEDNSWCLPKYREMLFMR